MDSSGVVIKNKSPSVSQSLLTSSLLAQLTLGVGFFSLCFACGSNENGGDSNGGSGGGSSTGGADGATGGAASGGGDGTGGSDGSTGGGPGTGGSTSTTGGIVPGTDHYDCSPPSGELPQLELVEYVTELDNP